MEGKKNVVIAVLDDHGHCSTSFMLGRCVDRSQAPACEEPVCTDAEWIRCPTGDAKRDCPAGITTCTGGLGRVCTTNLAQPCADASECPAATEGEVVDCVDKCSNRIERTCETDSDCAATLGPGTACIDGACSPRAPCVPLTGADPDGRESDFVCAHGFGRCNFGTNTCEGSNTPCSTNTDCNDYCAMESGVWRCKRTPTYCANNADCNPSNPNEVCTTSRHPLRLADMSCRYRQPGSNSWAFPNPTSLPPVTRENLVFTPTIDRLAGEGVVFSRGRASGVKCEPTRAVLQTGRVLRHRNAGNANDSGKGGQCRPLADWWYDVPIGCNKDDPNGSTECTNSFGRTCDDVTNNSPLSEAGGYHTLFWWMQDRPNGSIGAELLDTPSFSPPDVGTDDTFAIAAGKMEVPPSAAKAAWDDQVQQGGSPAFGKLTCLTLPGDACASALDAGHIPWVALDSSSNNSVLRVTDVLLENVTVNGLLRRPELPPTAPEKPMFLWYGAHLPHVGWAANKMTYFNAFYEPDVGGTLDAGEHHLGRTSLFDVGLDALIYDLKRTCVCGPPGQNPQDRQDSLWEHTVLVVVPDNTYLLPKSKAASGVDSVSENANRVPIIVREPGLKGAPFVMSDQNQFASQWDLLPTVLDYTNAYREQEKTAYATELNRYPLARNLRQQASGGIVDDEFQGVEIVRDVAYGALSETGIAETQVENQPRYLMPRAGMIGACFQQGFPFCLLPEGLEDPDPPGCGCLEVRHCANKRSAQGGFDFQSYCNSDDDCGTCNPTTHECEGGLPDFNGRPCDSGHDCAPIGVCRPPLLKIVQTGSIAGPTTRVYELNSDPDENVNLGTLALGGDLLTQATTCLTEFWRLTEADGDPSDLGVWQPVDEGCPDKLREWQTCTPPPPPLPAPVNCSP